MTNSYSIFFSGKALNDISDIYSYIAFELLVPQTAAKQVDRIRKAVRSLESMPSRHAIVDWEPWKSARMRKIFIDNFIVFYVVEEDSRCVNIVRIVYGKRDIENIVEETNLD